MPEITQGKLSHQETQNFLGNVRRLMQEQWLSKSSLARLMGKSDSADTINALNAIEKGKKNPTDKFVNKVATALGCSAEDLKQTPPQTVKAMTKPSVEFIKEANLKGHSLESVVAETRIPKEKLIKAINQGQGGLSGPELLQLDKVGLSPKTLKLFAGDNIAWLIYMNNKRQQIAKQGALFFQRRAAGILVKEFCVKNNLIKQVTHQASFEMLLKKSGMSIDEYRDKIVGNGIPGKHIKNAPPPTPDEWQRFLKAANAVRHTEERLVIMGRFGLSSEQAQQLKAYEKALAEAILTEYTHSEAARAMLRELQVDVFAVLEDIKQHELTKPNSEKLKEVLEHIFNKLNKSKLLVFTTALLTAFAKSLPLMAAEIAADEGVHYCKTETEHKEEHGQFLEAFLLTSASNILKLCFLLPKGMGSALTTPLDFSVAGNGFDVLLTYVSTIVRRFFEADGQAQAIVDDWKKLWSMVASHEPKSSEPIPATAPMANNLEDIEADSSGSDDEYLLSDLAMSSTAKLLAELNEQGQELERLQAEHQDFLTNSGLDQKGETVTFIGTRSDEEFFAKSVSASHDGFMSAVGYVPLFMPVPNNPADDEINGPAATSSARTNPTSYTGSTRNSVPHRPNNNLRPGDPRHTYYWATGISDAKRPNSFLPVFVKINNGPPLPGMPAPSKLHNRVSSLIPRPKR